MSKADLVFKETLQRILDEGVSDEEQQVRTVWKDGAPAHTLSVFGVVNRYNLQEEFPIITLRPTAFYSGLKEILWIYQDKSNNVQLLKDKYNIHWWDAWANQDSNLGRAYGYQMRQVHWYGEKVGYMSQIDKLIYDLKTNPSSRRLILNLYNHHDLHDMTLYPCAFMTMFDVREGKLNMTLTQRSSDYLVAGNINATQYALLQHMIAQSVGLEVGEFIHYINNCHIYTRHVDQAKEIIKREPRPVPKLIIDDTIKHFYRFKPEHFKLEGYNPHPQMKLEVAI
ncbi:thymidylate synthase [Bacillus sp. T33-2]|uniref:thymidylate synthase n=1 Tax=Bacillus sp. T33-2 TaxID=2054168 RepID=UPI000C772288|nr:thymidylate synthase [Bacillus sp. T33-2]PLR99489.1 thymidylate synthase [Bacillus sp. T33-2]